MSTVRAAVHWEGDGGRVRHRGTLLLEQRHIALYRLFNRRRRDNTGLQYKVDRYCWEILLQCRKNKFLDSRQVNVFGVEEVIGELDFRRLLEQHIGSLAVIEIGHFHGSVEKLWDVVAQSCQSGVHQSNIWPKELTVTAYVRHDYGKPLRMFARWKPMVPIVKVGVLRTPQCTNTLQCVPKHTYTITY